MKELRRNGFYIYYQCNIGKEWDDYFVRFDSKNYVLDNLETGESFYFESKPSNKTLKKVIKLMTR